MLDKHIASEGAEQKKHDASLSTGSVFVASYPHAETTKGDVSEMDERKVRDLEASTEHIPPVATLDVSFGLHNSPILLIIRTAIPTIRFANL